jgi:hypothetical protein
MSRKYLVDVLAFRVRDGELPAYRPSGDEEWYYVDDDGHTWKTTAGKNVVLPEIEIAGFTAESVTRMITRAIATIANLQEHGGTVLIFARSFHQVVGEKAVWTFVGSVVMTARKGQTVRDAVDLFDRKPVSVEGMSASMEIDDFTLEHLDYLDTVEDVHDL